MQKSEEVIKCYSILNIILSTALCVLFFFGLFECEHPRVPSSHKNNVIAFFGWSSKYRNGLTRWNINTESNNSGKTQFCFYGSQLKSCEVYIWPWVGSVHLKVHQLVATFFYFSGRQRCEFSAWPRLPSVSFWTSSLRISYNMQQ